MMSGFLGAMQHTEAGLMHYTPYLIDGPVLIRDNKLNMLSNLVNKSVYVHVCSVECINLNWLFWQVD